MSPGASKLVGRSEQVEAFDRALTGLSRGRPVTLGLAGEPGIGKTRLLVELATRAEERGFLVLRGSASELQGEVPFGVFVDALDEYVQGLAPQALGGLHEEVRCQLGHVLPSQPEPPRDRPVERFRIHRALRELLQALAGTGRLALLLDDVHWADSGSVDLLGMLVRRPSPSVLMAVAARPRQLPERLAAAFERAASNGDLTRLEVDRLNLAEATELLGEAVSEAAYEQSGGNPFYLQQLVRFPGREAAEAIRDEVGLLSPGTRRVLEGAGVVGDPFELDLAAAAADVSEDTMLEALDELLLGDLVRSTDVPRRFRFRHPLIRRAVYETTPGGWRIAAHARVGAALVARGAPAEVLAYHVEQSGHHGDPAAIAVLREAGHSVAQRTPAAAARWYAAALRLLPADAPLGDRTELLTAAAGSATAGGRFDDALEALVDAEHLIAVDDGVRRARVAAAMAQVEDLMSRHQDARRRLESAARTLDELPGPQAVALAQQLVINSVYRGANREADGWARRAQEVARTVGERSLLASSTAGLAFVAGMAGRVGDALAASDEAAALMDAMADAELATCVLGLCHLGSAELYLDRLTVGVVHAQRALTVARATGQVQLFPMIAPMVGWVLTVGGRLGEARDVLDGATEAARLTGSAQALAWALYTRTMNALYRGDLDVAVADGVESFELTADLEAGSGIACYAGVVYGLALAETGDSARAVAVASDRAGGAGLSFIPPAWRGFFLDRLVPAWLALGRFDDAHAAVEEAESAATITGLRSARSSALRARARVELDAGEASGAATHAAAAGDIAEGIGARVAAGASRVLAGRALAASGDAEGGIGVLRRAAEELDRCGAIRLRNEAERELGRLGQRRSRRGRPRPLSDADDDVATLTERELEVARLIVDRLTNAQIAGELFVSRKTVETHVRHLFEKLGVSSRVDVARIVEHAERAR